MRVLLLGLFGVLAATATVRGDSTAVVVGGKSDPHLQAIAEHAIGDSLRAAGWSSLDVPLAKSDADAIGQCFKEATPPGCVMHLVHDRGIGRVVFVLVDPDPPSADLKISARLVAANVSSVLSASQFCDHCTDDTLSRAVGEATRMLVERLALETGRAVLSVKSTPQGARFSVDGTFVGATDQSIDIAPGAHVVQIDHDGFDNATRNITAVEGKTSEISVTLHRTGSPEPDGSSSTTPDGHGAQSRNDKQHPSLVVPKTMVVVGAVAVVGGAIALALDQSDPIRPRGQPQPQFYDKTIVPGTIAIAGGAVLAGIGGYLWWRFTHENTAPAIAPVSGGGAVVSISGVF